MVLQKLFLGSTYKVRKKPVIHMCSCFSTVSITCINIQNLWSVFNQASLKIIDFWETGKAVFIYIPYIFYRYCPEWSLPLKFSKKLLSLGLHKKVRSQTGIKGSILQPVRMQLILLTRVSGGKTHTVVCLWSDSHLHGLCYILLETGRIRSSVGLTAWEKFLGYVWKRQTLWRHPVD